MTKLLKMPSLKRYLIDLNLDLARVISSSYRWEYKSKLCDVEYYVIILEDRRFFYHVGIDLKSIARELSKLVLLKKHGGGSTIDMQFVRTITERYERTLSRKMHETILSFLVQFHINKFAILRSYIDCAFFGSGLIGAEAASQKTFNLSYTDLKGYDAAFIASMLVYPRPLYPSVTWYEKTNRRALYALRVGSKLEKRFQKLGIR